MREKHSEDKNRLKRFLSLGSLIQSLTPFLHIFLFLKKNSITSINNLNNIIIFLILLFFTYIIYIEFIIFFRFKDLKELHENRILLLCISNHLPEDLENLQATPFDK